MFDLCKMIGYWRRQGDGFSYFMRGEEGRRGGGGGGGGPVPVFRGRDMFAFANSSVTESVLVIMVELSGVVQKMMVLCQNFAERF